ncbi:cadherin-23-like isoform X2 [Mya arenaria]|uniref:cadherin-23-like isoform X2 n=1 Tax=Mya arenaria TaxID=6604 RepID=UPI0022E90616|nr:cadherin-23-like isoform X2 [Mya arenaria]
MKNLLCSFLVLVTVFMSTYAIPAFNSTEKQLFIDKLKYGINEEQREFELMTIHCTDPENPQDQLSILLENGGNFVSISPTGRAFTRVRVKTLDFDVGKTSQQEQNEKSVVLTCSKGGSVYDRIEAKLKINDINDNAPEWINDVYIGNIDEEINEQLPYKVPMRTQILIIDKDGVDNNIITPNCSLVEIAPGNKNEPCEKYFSFKVLSYQNPLDQEYTYWTIDVFTIKRVFTGISTLRLVVEIVNKPNLVTEQTLKSQTRNFLIYVRDIQNLPPIFDQNSLSFSMNESTQPGDQVEFGRNVIASDQDRGDPNAIRFELRRNPDDPYAFDNDLFELGVEFMSSPNRSAYGVPFKLKNNVDREAIINEAKSLSIDIIAIEYDPDQRANRNPMNTTSTLVVRVIDSNDNPPRFSQDVYTYDITELTNIVVNDYRQLTGNFQIDVSDSDSFLYNKFRVSIVEGGQNGNFSLLNFTEGQKTSSFLIYVRSPLLNYEVPPNQYSLKLRAEDILRPDLQSEAIVNINILDANDNFPLFSQPTYVCNVQENQEPGILTQTGCSLTARDADSGAFGEVTGYEVNDNTNTFTIDENGNLFLERPLDFETQSVYTFTATAYDGGTLDDRKSGTAFVNVVVGNIVEDGPQFTQTYSSTLYEDSLELQPAIILQAVNIETQGDIIYSLVRIEPATIPLNTIRVNSTTGVVSVINYVDYKTTQNGTIFLTFRATTGALFSETVATIVVFDLNNYAPEFLPLGQTTFSAIIYENATAGDVVIDLNVRDRDETGLNGQVEFKILSGDNDVFLIRSDSGEIIIGDSSTLDVERQSRYNIEVEAGDKGTPPRYASVMVNIQILDSNNKNPRFLKELYVFQINENAAINTRIGNVIANDTDSTNSLEYSIDFTSVNFEKGGNQLDTYIDAEKIVSMQPLTGEIRVAGTINRALFDGMDFKVVVQDINAPANGPRQTATASVLIFILADPDPRIYFDAPWTRQNPIIRKTYSETNNVGYQILVLRATDPAVPETVQIYREMSGSDPNDYFEISNSSVIIKKRIDYETLPALDKTISVVVLAISRNEDRTATATVIIDVQDLNDNEPQFDRLSYTFAVPEDKKYPYTVGEVIARDADSSSYGEIEYFLAGSRNEDFDVYTERVGSETKAVIIVSQTAVLDYESYKEYNIELIATDKQFPVSTTLIINIGDKNDVIPHFDERIYNFSIIGTQDTGRDVGYVFAMDEDSGLNGDVDYSIVSSTNQGYNYFGIETVDVPSSRPDEKLKRGRIYVRRSLQALADRTVFNMTVYARDKGSPPLDPGKCIVIITVSKGVQDMKPKWDENLNTKVQIPEGTPIGNVVYTVKAYAANATSGIIYSFAGFGDALKDYENFNIDPNTGVITVGAELDFEKKHVYNLQIRATDSMNDTLTNQFLLIVEVLDIEDNDPSFLDCPGRQYPIPVVASVSESMMPPRFVYQVLACDLDQPPHDDIKYSWYFDPQNAAEVLCKPDIIEKFTLNSTTGDIHTAAILDREVKDEYLLCVQVSQVVGNNRKKRDLTADLTAKNISSTVLFIQVIVIDENDEGPKFINHSVINVIDQFPSVDIYVAEAVDRDLPPHNNIRYSIDKTLFVIGGKPQQAPTAFTINANDGTVSIGTNDYTDYIDGYFDITIKAEDRNGENNLTDYMQLRVYVTERSNFIRVVINKPADTGVETQIGNLLKRLNSLESNVFYKVMSISNHVISNDAAPSFESTDVCLVVVRNNNVMSSLDAAKRLNNERSVTQALNEYEALDPGPCDPAKSVYPVGWESYWWVLVAFAIFIFICCIILIALIVALFEQHEKNMKNKPYFVQSN